MPSSVLLSLRYCPLDRWANDYARRLIYLPQCNPRYNVDVITPDW